MAALAWLLIPVVAAALGVIWVSWATRQRSTVGDAAGVAGYERFREAMERSRAGTGARVPVATSSAPAAADQSARTAD